MGLRCLLFLLDDAAVEIIGDVVNGLGMEAEPCSESDTGLERVSRQSFQIVIVDWDRQPEAEAALAKCRERKSPERPMTLAIVREDAGVPKALQAGATSVLRKPLRAAAVKDTLTAARNLMRAKLDPPAARAAAVGAPVSKLPASGAQRETTLRAGEFLQSGPVPPSGQFITESDAPISPDQVMAGPVDPLEDLEPMAAAVAQQKTVPTPVPAAAETHGLEYYLKTRAGKLPTAATGQAAAPALAPSAPAKLEVLGYNESIAETGTPPGPLTSDVTAEQWKFSQDQLTSDRDGQPVQDRKTGHPVAEEKAPFRLGKGAISFAVLLAAMAIVAAPQAPWHPQTKIMWTRGQVAVHRWLHPQPVTPAQAATSHENFGRAGDEYKMPVAENIPDATTDPSQIQVVPVVDPTAKKPTNDNATSDPAAVSPGPGTPADPGTAPADSAHETPQPGTQATISTPTVIAPRVQVERPVVVQPAPVTMSAPTRQESHTAPGTVPQSLRSQMSPSAPNPGGNKLPESAMPSIEPVDVPEATERGLLTEQPTIEYPANLKGQAATVVLQVLISREGMVQDAKFMQGSLGFARAAIDGVKAWKFQPYSMNGRPVSVRSVLTINFKPSA
jgi:protein TonB